MGEVQRSRKGICAAGRKGKGRGKVNEKEMQCFGETIGSLGPSRRHRAHSPQKEERGLTHRGGSRQQDAILGASRDR